MNQFLVPMPSGCIGCRTCEAGPCAVAHQQAQDVAALSTGFPFRAAYPGGEKAVRRIDGDGLSAVRGCACAGVCPRGDSARQ